MKYENYSFNHPTVSNYYGEEFKTINNDFDSKFRIRRFYNTKIRNLRVDLKNEQRINRNLYKKIKFVKDDETKNSKKKIKNSSKFDLDMFNELIKFKKRYPTLEDYLDYQIKLRAKEILKSKRDINKQLKHVAKAGDEHFIKEENIDRLININTDKNEVTNEEILQIINFIEKKKETKLTKSLVKTFEENTKIANEKQAILEEKKISVSKQSKNEIEKIRKQRATTLLETKAENISVYDQFKKQINGLIEEKKERIAKFVADKNKKVIKTGKYHKNFTNILNLWWMMVKTTFTAIPFSFRFKEKYYNSLKEYHSKRSLINKGMNFGSELSKENAKHFSNAVKNNRVTYNEFKKELSQFKTLKIKRDKIKSEIKELKNVFKKDLKLKQEDNLNKLKSKDLNIKAFLKNRRDIKAQSKIDMKMEVDKVAEQVSILTPINLWRKFRFQLRYNAKTLYSEIENSVKHIPIQLRVNVRWVLAIANFVLPGISWLFAKQWKKAFWTFVGTAFMYGVLLAYGFGAYNFNGTGVFGLKTLGSESRFDDSRFFLIEGTTALVFMVSAIVYGIMMGYSGYKMGLLMEKGVRVNTWFMSKKEMSKHGFPYLMSAPSMFFVVYTTIMPIMVTLLMSFTNYGFNHNPTQNQDFEWVKFDNYEKLFSSKLGFFDDLSKIIGWTLIWTFATTFLTLFVGFGLALMLNNDRIKFSKAFRIMHIIPWVIPGFVFILLFYVLLKAPTSLAADDGGPLYDLFCKVGLWHREKILPSGVHVVNSMMAEAGSVKLLLIAIQVWLGVAGTSVFYSGMLKGIPKTLYEAAKIDGANDRKQLFNLTIPILLIAIAPLLIKDLIGNFNNFGVIWLFADGGPALEHPSVLEYGQTDIVLSWIYKTVQNPAAFRNSMGISSAAIVVLSIIMVSIGYSTMGRTKAFSKREV